MTEETNDRRRKCEVRHSDEDGHYLLPCFPLGELTEGSGRGKGIRHHQLVNFKTSKATRQLWVLHSGEHTKKGIVLNYCPCCGTKIIEVALPETKASDDDLQEPRA